MSKKILGAAAALLFIMCLIVTSNIQETGKGGPVADSSYNPAGSAAEENDAVAAGVFLAFSEHSFTTESDEKTSIEKNDIIWVASAGSPNDGNEVIGNEVKTEYNISNEEGVPDLTEMLTGKASPEDPQDLSSAREDSKAQEEALEQEAEEPAEQSKETAELDEMKDMKSDGAMEAKAAQTYGNRWNITLTEEEIELLARIVWLEANGEPVEGQEAIVEVVFNRMTSDLYPDTLYDVLSQRNPVQFCSWKNRGIAQPTQKEYDSIYSVLHGNTNLLRNDTMYFSTFPLTSNQDVKICCHYFCY